MPGKRFTAKEDRQAAHVAASMKKKGKSAKAAKSIGYATVVSHGGGKRKGKK